MSEVSKEMQAAEHENGLRRGPQSYPIFSAMHSDDDASLSSEPSHNHIHKVPCTLPYTAQTVHCTDSFVNYLFVCAVLSIT